ncbi:Hypothetical_protein [Hexamita inflata]|uniref:Hypothetical_protein n=1 Tax=Hexamita inflata TaxID=28002 RepID=A0AA86U951_9EUKA|nr:Hypothetical protein HINF_LOCUS35940 [Hexamita inflata]
MKQGFDSNSTMIGVRKHSGPGGALFQDHCCNIISDNEGRFRFIETSGAAFEPFELDSQSLHGRSSFVSLEYPCDQTTENAGYCPTALRSEVTDVVPCSFAATWTPFRSVPAHSCQTQCAVGAKLSSLVSLERIQIAMFMIQLGADMLLQWPIALSPRTIRIRLAPTTSRHVRGADFIIVVPAFKSL